MSEIPRDSVRTRPRHEWASAGAQFVVRRGRKRTHHVARGGKDFHRYRLTLGRRRTQYEVDDRSVRRVLSLTASTEASASTTRESIRGPRRDEKVLSGGHICGLLQRRQVIEDPEAPARSRHDEVVVPLLNHQVVDWRVRQVELQGLPQPATVERDVHAGLGPRVKQTGTHRILTDDMHPGIGIESGRDLGPVPAEVGRLERPRCEVVELVAIVGHVSRRRVVGRHRDRVDETLLQTSRGDVIPGDAVVSSEVHEPVVAAGPQGTRRVR